MAVAQTTIRASTVGVARRTRTPREVVWWALIDPGAERGGVRLGFPFIWMILTLLKTRADAVRTTPTVFPDPWYNPLAWKWHNYVEAWTAAPFGRYFDNTTFIAVMVVIGMLFTSVLAAYAFARMEFWGKNVIFALFLATMMIPFETTLIPTTSSSPRSAGTINSISR